MSEKTPRYTCWSFTYGDKQDAGSWWRSLPDASTETYTTSSGVIASIVWGTIHSTACADYLGDGHRHGRISFKSGGRGHKYTKNNAFKSWAAAMKSLHPESVVENTELYFQPTISAPKYDNYAGIKRKQDKRDILDDAKAECVKKGKPVNEANLLFEVAEHQLNNYSKVKAEVSAYVELQSPQFQLLVCNPEVTTALMAKHSQSFCRGLIDRIKHASIKGLKGYCQDEKRTAVLLHLLCINTCRRNTLDKLPAIFLMGQAGVGKTTAFFNQHLIHRVATDADGVGRYTVKSVQTTILYEEWAFEKLLQPDNIGLFKQLAVGQSTTIKVHGSTTKLAPLWVAMTTNTDYDSMEQLITERDPNEASALRRRILSVHWNDCSDFKTRAIQHMDISMIISLLVCTVFSELGKDPCHRLLRSEYRPYLKAMYDGRYQQDLAWFNNLSKTDHQPVVLSFDPVDESSSEAGSDTDGLFLKTNLCCADSTDD